MIPKRQIRKTWPHLDLDFIKMEIYLFLEIQERFWTNIFIIWSVLSKLFEVHTTSRT